jgi:hypothetical protein
MKGFTTATYIKLHREIATIGFAMCNLCVAGAGLLVERSCRSYRIKLESWPGR